MSSIHPPAQDLDWIDHILMSTGLHDPSPSLPVCWEITPTPDGVELSVWEPAPIAGNRINPYLYRANYRLESHESAHRVLQHYLTVG